MNEVTRDNYDKLYPTIRTTLENATFICIDAEFTGLHSNVLQSSLFDSMQERYSILRNAIEPFVVIQFGIAAFKHMRKENRYSVEAYQFFLVPKDIPTKNRCFTWQAAAVEFLTGHSIDFNKVVYKGISFINQNDEILIRKYLQDEKLREMIELNLSYKVIEVFMKHCNDVSLWLNKNSEESEIFMIEASSPELKYLLHKELRARFSNIWTVDGQNMVNVIKVTEEVQKTLLKESNNIDNMILDSYLGFSKIFKLLTELKKPIIGHNAFLDLMFMHKLFYQPLPKKYKEFKRNINKLFPVIFDTKYLSYELSTKLHKNEKWNVNSLESLYNYFDHGKGRFAEVIIPDIEFSQEVDPKSAHFHHAGWDAYYTGYIFLKMSSKFITDKYSVSYSSKPLTYTEMMSALKTHINCINLPRASIQYIKLDGPDPISKRPPWLYIKTLIPATFDLSQLAKKLSTFGLVDIKPFTPNRAVVAVSNYGSAQSILNHFRNSKELYVTVYCPIRHSPLAKLALWSGALLSGSLIAWMLHRSIQKSI